MRHRDGAASEARGAPVAEGGGVYDWPLLRRSAQDPILRAHLTAILETYRLPADLRAAILRELVAAEPPGR